jgi:hypothetical protein
MWKWRMANRMTTDHGRGNLMVQPNGKVEEAIVGNLTPNLCPQETVIIIIMTGQTRIGNMIGMETGNGNEIEIGLGNTTMTVPDWALPQLVGILFVSLDKGEDDEEVR